MQSPEIVIIGGGLSGLTTAFLLEQQGLAVRILEARDRLGGRIHTLRGKGEPPIEMGATWLGLKHRHLRELLDELGIDVHEQYMGDKGYYEPMSVSPPQLVELPPNESPSFRITGGSDRMIRALAERLEQSRVQLGRAATAIRESDDRLEVEAAGDCYVADMVVSTLPPRLLMENLDLPPSLPESLGEIASHTHTWMADAIKVALTYEQPFWRERESSGTIFSNVGPVSEMYDHSGKGGYALKGFMDGSYATVSREQRRAAVLEQLYRFYGEQAARYISYRDQVWRREPLTFCDYESPVIPHQHNGHPVFRREYLGGKLLLAGAETAEAYPGYMDGAVESARRAAEQVAKRLG